MAEPRKPSPNFYKVVAVLFLVIGAGVIWAAVVRHEWVFGVIGIMTIINAGMALLKSLVPRETKP